MSEQKLCSVGCGRPARKNGMCSGHDWRASHGKPMDAPIRRYNQNSGTCSVVRCTHAAKRQGLCMSHYTRKAEGRPDWKNVLRPCSRDTARLGTPVVPNQVLAVLDREAEALAMSRLELTRRILTRWANEQLERRGM